MADLRDVLDALVGVAVGAAYPQGTDDPSVTARPVAIFPGWPIPDHLNALIARGESCVSVYAGDSEKDTTRYLDDWREHAVPARTITATVAAGDVTLAGTPSDVHVVTLIVDGKAYSYGVLVTDTLATIAAALAVLVNADTPSTSSGAHVLIPAASKIVARVGVIGTGIHEIAQQEKAFQVTIWAPSDDDRTALGRALTPAIQRLNFVTLPDGTKGRLQYTRTKLTDHLEKQRIYRRDIFVTVEWSTTETMDVAQITSTTLEADQMVGAECVPIISITV